MPAFRLSATTASSCAALLLLQNLQSGLHSLS